jgi:hypothetical protein
MTDPDLGDPKTYGDPTDLDPNPQHCSDDMKLLTNREKNNWKIIIESVSHTFLGEIDRCYCSFTLLPFDFDSTFSVSDPTKKYCKMNVSMVQVQIRFLSEDATFKAETRPGGGGGRGEGGGSG